MNLVVFSCSSSKVSIGKNILGKVSIRRCKGFNDVLGRNTMDIKTKTSYYQRIAMDTRTLLLEYGRVERLKTLTVTAIIIPP